MKKIFHSTQLKTIAVLAMTLDHAALLFLPASSPLYECMRFIGRWTAPIMSFFLAEGFVHTKNFGRYLRRLLFFALLAQPAYFVMVTGRTPLDGIEFLTHKKCACESEPMPCDAPVPPSSTYPRKNNLCFGLLFALQPL